MVNGDKHCAKKYNTDGGGGGGVGLAVNVFNKLI
jgi:hypothetical protein